MNRRTLRDLWLCLTLLCALAAILSALSATLAVLDQPERTLGRLLQPRTWFADPTVPEPGRERLFLPPALALVAWLCHRRYQAALTSPPPPPARS